MKWAPLSVHLPETIWEGVREKRKRIKVRDICKEVEREKGVQTHEHSEQHTVGPLGLKEWGLNQICF